jgi:hypothetical protein
MITVILVFQDTSHSITMHPPERHTISVFQIERILFKIALYNGGTTVHLPITFLSTVHKYLVKKIEAPP